MWRGEGFQDKASYLSQRMQKKKASDKNSLKVGDICTLSSDGLKEIYFHLQVILMSITTSLREIQPSTYSNIKVRTYKELSLQEAHE